VLARWRQHALASRRRYSSGGHGPILILRRFGAWCRLEAANRDIAGVRLSEIVALADGLAGCSETPSDSQVYFDGDVRRVFVGIDVDVSGALLARDRAGRGGTAARPTRAWAPAG